MPDSQVIDAALLQQAADWAITLRYEQPSDAQRQAFEQWHRQSHAHAAAWARAQAVFHTFGQVPADIGKDALDSLKGAARARRRRSLLGVLLVAAPAGWLALRQTPWGARSADLATATGERRAVSLPDGSHLVLNTASAVNIAFGTGERRIHLVAGEILVTTHADPAPTPRPFLVDSGLGVVRALGTRFSVRRLDDAACRVAVFDSAIEIRPLAGATLTLHAGQQADFGAVGVAVPTPVERSAALWEHGTLLAKDMRLGDVIAELARNRPGLLRCDPVVADMPVSGAISLADTDDALDLLASSLPLRIERRTRYWVTVGPRN